MTIRVKLVNEPLSCWRFWYTVLGEWNIKHHYSAKTGLNLIMKKIIGQESFCQISWYVRVKAPLHVVFTLSLILTAFQDKYRFMVVITTEMEHFSFFLSKRFENYFFLTRQCEGKSKIFCFFVIIHIIRNIRESIFVPPL